MRQGLPYYLRSERALRLSFGPEEICAPLFAENSGAAMTTPVTSPPKASPRVQGPK